MALCVFWCLNNAYNYIVDLYEYRQSITEQTKALEVEAERQTNELKTSLSKAQISADQNINAINDKYNDLLNERLQQHAISEQVSTATRTTTTAKHPDSSQSSRASGELSKKLLRCEARLLYEAKEYDILATHYNVLLSTYEQARLINGNQKSKQNQKDTQP